MTTPITAYVGEPVKVERPIPPTPTRYAIRGWRWDRDASPARWIHILDPINAKDKKAANETATLYARAGDENVQVITIPGTDAAPGWRDAKEPPDTHRNVAVRVRGIPETQCAFYEDGGWSWPTGDPVGSTAVITHWAELPAPPKGASNAG